MNHPENGWHNASTLEIDEMKKNGWVESSEEERQKIILNKGCSEPKPTEDGIIEVQNIPENKPKRGRQKKV